MNINLPNRITLARLALAIVFFVLLAQFNVRKPDVVILDACIILFALAAATDWLDGHLARKLHQVTSFGRILDPFVDKVLVCGTFVFLAGPGFINAEHTQVTCVAPWMVVLIIGRELLVTGLRGFSESKGKAFGASAYGKTKMVLQSITAPTLMLFVAHIEPHPGAHSLEWIKVALVWLTVIATTGSMIPYLFQSKEILADAGT